MVAYNICEHTQKYINLFIAMLWSGRCQAKR